MACGKELKEGKIGLCTDNIYITSLCEDCKTKLDALEVSDE